MTSGQEAALRRDVTRAETQQKKKREERVSRASASNDEIT